jgi:hypothetical protein
MSVPVASWVASASGGMRFDARTEFQKKRRPSAVLTDGCLEGSTGGTTNGRKKRKGFHWFRLELTGRSPSIWQVTPDGSDWR